MEVPGKIILGIPELRWLANIRNDFLERELPVDEAQYRFKWRHLIRTSIPLKSGKGLGRSWQ